MKDDCLKTFSERETFNKMLNAIVIFHSTLQTNFSDLFSNKSHNSFFLNNGVAKFKIIIHLQLKV